VSSPDRDRHGDAVRRVLAEVGADKVPVVEVFNKCDRLDAGERARLRATQPGALCVSARTGEGRDDLIAAMETRLALDTVRVTVTLPAHGAETNDRVAELYRIARIVRHVATDEAVSVEADIPRRLLPRFQAAMVETS
jgi:GTPase